MGGRLCVNPLPDEPHDRLEEYFVVLLRSYARSRADVINRVTNKARIMTQSLGDTNAEPDVAAYRDYPLSQNDLTWKDVTPLVVVEVVSANAPDKDLVRNRDLYWRVPSIQEYWIVDPRDDPARPSMLALARGPEAWVETSVDAGGTYRTDLLPDLVVDLSAIYPGG